jgi:hypothetical protein
MKDICVLTIIKNEHDYLDEWLTYHLNLGIDKIYVFEDIGSHSHASICSKYNNVELNSVLSVYDDNIYSDMRMLQMRYMFSCLDYIKRTNSDALWVAYIDADEFLTLENEANDIHNVMKGYSEYNLVSLQWKNFNASGHIYKPQGTCIENYVTPCQLFAGRKMTSFASCKLFINMYWYSKRPVKFTIHTPCCNKYWCKTDFSINLMKTVYDKIYIRHYITKSFEEYCRKIFVRGQFNNSKDLDLFFRFNKDISRDDSRVVEMINEYYERFMSGELNYHLSNV